MRDMLACTSVGSATRHVLHCGLCGERRELIAQITRPGVVMPILSSLGLPTEAPRVRPARGPPELF